MTTGSCSGSCAAQADEQQRRFNPLQ